MAKNKYHDTADMTLSNAMQDTEAAFPEWQEAVKEALALEKERLAKAEAEIARLDALEKTVENGLDVLPLTPAQVVTGWQELRRIIELRARLTGALPPAVVIGNE